MTEEQKAARAANLAKARARQQEKVKAATAPARPAEPEQDPVDTERVPIREPDDGAIERAAERRARLLGDLDPETAALFSDAELEKIETEEHDKALAEQKKLALADVRATARQQARVDHDLIPAAQLRSDAERARLSELVSFKVTLPGDGAGHRGRSGFRIDGRLFQTGRTYTEPRAVFESLLSNHYRAWLSEIQFKTLDQHKPGGSAQEVLSQTAPIFEVPLHA